MLTIDGASEALEGLYREFKEISRAVYLSVEEIGRPQHVVANEDLFKYFSNGNYLYILEGFFRLHRASREVRLYSEGDFLGFQGLIGGCTLSSEYTTEVVLIDRREFVDTLKRRSDLLDRWLELRDLENRINLGISVGLARERVAPSMALCRFKDGETIIAEGSAPEEVYEMISGVATVEVRNVTVGTIGRGEIFGEMSFLAECPRTATVKADGPCCVRVVKKEAFFSMLEVNTFLGQSIARTLVKRIMALNQRVVGP